jgi:transposase
MNVRYIVELDEAERQELLKLTSTGAPRARKMKRAQILLLSDEGKPDGEIAEVLHVGTSTVYRTKQRFVEEGLEQALSERPGRGGERKLDAQQEAMLVALACSKPPTGRRRWTLQLLADELVVLANLGSLSYETVRRRLEENELKPWQKKMWCLPKVDARFVAQMEDILDLYAEPAEPTRPVVCFDETPTQLIGEKRVPLPTLPPSSGCSPSTKPVRRWPGAIHQFPCDEVLVDKDLLGLERELRELAERRLAHAADELALVEAARLHAGAAGHHRRAPEDRLQHALEVEVAVGRLLPGLRAQHRVALEVDGEVELLLDL